MVVEIDVVYRGELRCEAAHGPSKRELQTDAPVDNCGNGESFSPTDLAVTALGTCMLTIMGIAAEKHGIDLRGTRIHLEKHMVADPLRRISRIPIRIEIPAQVSEENRTRLQQAAMTCPVMNSLDPRIEKPVEFVWGATAASTR